MTITNKNVTIENIDKLLKFKVFIHKWNPVQIIKSHPEMKTVFDEMFVSFRTQSVVMYINIFDEFVFTKEIIPSLGEYLTDIYYGKIGLDVSNHV